MATIDLMDRFGNLGHGGIKNNGVLDAEVLFQPALRTMRTDFIQVKTGDSIVYKNMNGIASTWNILSFYTGEAQGSYVSGIAGQTTPQSGVWTAAKDGYVRLFGSFPAGDKISVTMTDLAPDVEDYLAQYNAMNYRFLPNSIPKIVAHIQEYLSDHPIADSTTLQSVIDAAFKSYMEEIQETADTYIAEAVPPAAAAAVDAAASPALQEITAKAAEAAESAREAALSEQSAEMSEENALSYRNQAQQIKDSISAEVSASVLAAQEQATLAQESAQAADQSADTAELLVAQARAQAEAAADHAQTASGYASDAHGYMQDASGYAQNASDYADNAAQSAATFSTDPTLTISGKAADAKATGDELSALKNALVQTTGVEFYKFIEKNYIPLGPTGSVVTGTPTPDNDTDCVIVPCTPGDAFTLTAKAWSSSKYRLYAFLTVPDQSGYTVVTSSTETSVTEKKITAPEASAYLAVNVKRGTDVDPVLCKGKLLPEEIQDIYTTINNGIEDINEKIEPVFGYGHDITSEIVLISGDGINPETGELATSTTYSHTDYIAIDRSIYDRLTYGRIGATSVYTNAGMAFYDEQKNYIAGYKNTTGYVGHRDYTVDIPVLARFARFSVRTESSNTFNLVLINDGSIKKSMAKIGVDTVFLSNYIPDGVYENENIEYTGLSTIADVYSAYDAIMDNNVGITKNVIGYGSDVSGNPDNTLPIYEYVFLNPVAGNEIIQAPKVLFTSGIHGGEKTAVVGLYNFVKSMFDITNKIGKAIRNIAEFHVVPIINPGGFNAGTRNNLHGVDLNRNFGFNWGGRVDEGVEPYSEVETQAMKAWLSRNTDALFMIDFHNHNQLDQGSTTIMYYTASNVPMHRKAWSCMFRRLIPYFLNEYSIDISTYYHVIEANNIAGIAAEAYEIEKIDASIFETPIGASEIHAKKATETTGDFILTILKNYKV